MKPIARPKWIALLAVLAVALGLPAGARTRPAASRSVPIAATPSPEEPVIVTGVSWNDGELVFEANRPMRARTLLLDHPDRVVVDLLRAELADPALAQAVPIGRDGILQLRAALHSEEGFIRFVLDCDRPATAQLSQQHEGTILRVRPYGDAPIALGPPLPQPTLGPPLPRDFLTYGPPIDDSWRVQGPPVPSGWFLVGPPAPEPSEQPSAAVELAARDEESVSPRYGRGAWDGQPQPLERLSLKRKGRLTTLRLAAGRKLAYEIAEEHAPPRLVIRVPRGSYPKDPPQLDGLESHVSQDGSDWVWQLGLPHELPQLEARRLDGGNTLELSWQTNALAGKRPLVVVDAGHGGVDPGAIGPTGRHESLLTLGLAQQLRQALEESGKVRVAMTRTADVTVDLASRARLSTALHPAMFVSLHGNSCTTPEIGGLETFYRTPGSLPLARHLHHELVRTLGRPDRGVRQARLYVLRNGEVPSVLIESGYVSNASEEALLAEPKFQRELGQSLARAILDWLDRVPLAVERPATPGM